MVYVNRVWYDNNDKNTVTFILNKALTDIFCRSLYFVEWKLNVEFYTNLWL